VAGDALLIGRATDSASLAVLSGQVHDAWFELARVHHAQSTVTVPLDSSSRNGLWGRGGRPPDCGLVIRQVIDFHFEDEAEVGFYDIHSVSATDSQELQLRSNMPMVLIFRITGIDVELRRLP